MGVRGDAVIRFTLPWPHKDLSPNARVHWARRAKRTKAARRYALFWCGVVYALHPMRFGGKVKVHLAFAPPDKRKRDAHNLAGSMKAGIDGIADALHIDDSRFIVSHELLDEVVKGGEVRVTVEAA